MHQEIEKVGVLYAGPLNAGGTDASRLQALESWNPCVYRFDTQDYFGSGMSRWRRAIELRIFCGPGFRKANADLLEACKTNQPEIVWVDKGFWVFPSTLAVLRRQGIFLVQHNTDALFPAHLDMRWSYSMLRRTLRYYDLYFTSNIPDFERMKDQRPPRTVQTFLGYDSDRFNNSELAPSVTQQWAHDVLFVGHYEPNTERGILALIEAGLPVTVYGAGWESSPNRSRLAGHVKMKTLNNQEYVYALKSAKIGLCFVSQINGNQTAGRSFEIPASGTFLLAMRTPGHQECYQEGVEAEFFSSPGELVEKVRIYLQNEEGRREIAARGHERCMRSGYSWADQMRRDWSVVLEMLSESRSNGLLIGSDIRPLLNETTGA